MTTSTLLLYAKQTGHVLAAATTAAEPSEDLKPEALAGDLFPIRHNGDPAADVLAEPVNVPASELAIASVDAGSVPIAAARAFALDPQTKAPQPLLFTAANTPTLTASNAMLTIGLKSAAKAFVWARVEPLGALAGQIAPQIVTAKATPGTPLPGTVNLAVNPLPSGQYGALVLEPGTVPLLQTFNI